MCGNLDVRNRVFNFRYIVYALFDSITDNYTNYTNNSSYLGDKRTIWIITFNKIIFFFMKVIGEFIVSLLMVIVASLVVAWGYQVFWNEIVLNVWQLFTTGDVLTTMRIPYGACLAIAFGIGLIHNKKVEKETKSVSETVSYVMTKSVSKVIMIGVTLLVTYLVF